MESSEIESLRELISGVRKPESGMEKHFLRVIEGKGDPCSPLEIEWYNFWIATEKQRSTGSSGESLSSVADNAYCIDCSAQIPEARLKAVPGALRCIACQTNFETHNDIKQKASENSFLGNIDRSNRSYSRDDS